MGNGVEIFSIDRNYLTGKVRRDLVKLVYKSGPLSRRHIASKLGIRQASINSYVKELEDGYLITWES